MLVEETVYQPVVRTYCRMVPEVKKMKKTVYSFKDVPYCLTECPNPFHRRGAGEACTTCEQCARCRRVLVKHEVTEEVPGYKCVVETVTEQVPCTIYRRVPCAEASKPADITPVRAEFPMSPRKRELPAREIR